MGQGRRRAWRFNWIPGAGPGAVVFMIDRPDDSVYEWMERLGLVDDVLGGLALATPLAALAVAVLGRGRPWLRDNPRLRADLAVAAASGPLLAGLWRVYNGVLATWGFDSLAAVGVNAAVFAATAVAIGLTHRALARRPAPRPFPGEPPVSDGSSSGGETRNNPTETA